MRASRLLSIQMMLETRGQMSARALAEALEVSLRTLHRDIDQLAAAGVPIYAERGRAGGYRLLDGWNTRLTGLTPSEAQVVFLSGLAGPAADLGLGPPLQSAQLKLLTALPESARNEARKMQSHFHLDPVDWYREAEHLPHLALIAESVWNQRQISIGYESWRKEVDRLLHPLGLVLKAGAWYLVASDGGAPRTYRIANIKRAAMSESPARRPRGFDLAAYWRDSVTRFETELYTGLADVLATPAGLKNLRFQSAAVAHAVQAGVGAPGADGRVALRIPIEGIDNAVIQMTKLAPDVEVVAPPTLRKAVIARLRQALSLYGAA